MLSLSLFFSCVQFYSVEMGNGKWKMGYGKWSMGNGRWEMGIYSNVGLGDWLGDVDGSYRKKEKKKKGKKREKKKWKSIYLWKLEIQIKYWK